MDQRNCNARGCNEPAKVFCEGTHVPMKFCSKHFEEHSNESGIHKIVESSDMNLKMVNHYNIISNDQANLKNYHILSVNKSIYFLVLNVIEISIPGDYEQAARSMAKKLGNSICNIPNGKSEEIQNKCRQYVNAMKKLIYNLELDSEFLSKELLSIYNKFHSKIEEAVSSGLFDLLLTMEKLMEMPATTKKKFIITLRIEDEKQRFIEKFLSKDEIDYKTLFDSFISSFSYFMKGKNTDGCLQYFKNFSEYFQREKDKFIDEAMNEALDFLSHV